MHIVLKQLVQCHASVSGRSCTNVDTQIEIARSLRAQPFFERFSPLALPKNVRTKRWQSNFLWCTQVNKSHGKRFIIFFESSSSSSNLSCSRRKIISRFQSQKGFFSCESRERVARALSAVVYLARLRQERSQQNFPFITHLNPVSVLMNLCSLSRLETTLTAAVVIKVNIFHFYFVVLVSGKALCSSCFAILVFQLRLSFESSEWILIMLWLGHSTALCSHCEWEAREGNAYQDINFNPRFLILELLLRFDAVMKINLPPLLRQSLLASRLTISINDLI